MNPINLDTLLQPVSPDHPAGEDLEYDPAFLEAAKAAAGVPEHRMGDTVVPAQEPNWSRVRQLALDLFERSKDLRIGVLLTRALLHTHGLPGLHSGLCLIGGLVSRFWDDLYPALDPSEANDPTARVNTLLELCDRDSFLRPLRATPLAVSRVLGRVAYRDIEVAEGKAPPPPDTQPPNLAAIAGAFQDCDLAELADAAAGSTGALAQVHALREALESRIGANRVPNLEPLADLLAAIDRVLQTRLAERQPAPTSAGVAPDTIAPHRQGAPGVIASREDVVHMLDRLCDYYLHNEPSSPIPLLLQRARRLVTGTFVDIVRDLAPDALPQIEKACGLDKKT